jgi:hypothetical protein
VKVTIYIEGGGDRREGKARCREAFVELFRKLGLKKQPSANPYGGRQKTFDAFKHENSNAGDFIALLVDSEESMDNLEATWAHLANRDQWQKPENATDDQVLMMTTCMETWIVADRETLKSHYGQHLQESALPVLHQLETRGRGDVQQNLGQATQNCKNKYQKGNRSFEILAKLDPAVLGQHLPSFVRVRSILTKKCR